MRKGKLKKRKKRGGGGGTFVGRAIVIQKETGTGSKMEEFESSKDIANHKEVGWGRTQGDGFKGGSGCRP